jgi:hypothetical protein
MYNQPQPSYYPQNQYTAPMGFSPEYNDAGMGSMMVEEVEPKLSLLS